MLPHFHFDEVRSTQDKAFEMLEAKVEAPFIVSADFQTLGRGRMGRQWISEAGRSLMMSLLYRIESSRLMGLSLVVGLSVRRALSIEGLLLKWPNDLMLDDRKVGGILVESRSQAEGAFVAIGVGLNLLDLQSAPFVGIQKKVDPKDIGDRIVEDLLTFEKTGFKNFKESFEAVMWRKGEEVSLKVDDKIREVRLEGVSDDGLLMTRSHGALNLSEHGEIVSA